ncbi:hypothetical protein [Bradyrhizobium sp. 186]|nr:hypothetical protein [Bradyrhizobium sp. 186]
MLAEFEMSSLDRQATRDCDELIGGNGCEAPLRILILAREGFLFVTVI